MKFIRVYCGVKYEDKDVAKSLGFRYDQDEKRWFKQFAIEDDKDATFGDFKPFKVEIVDIVKNMKPKAKEEKKKVENENKELDN